MEIWKVWSQQDIIAITPKSTDLTNSQIFENYLIGGKKKNQIIQKK